MTANAKKHERRKSHRLGVKSKSMIANCRLLETTGDGQFSFGVWKVYNLSLSGMTVVCEEAVTPESLVFLNVDLETLNKTIGVVAKVVWHEEVEGRHEMGISFCWWPNKKDEQALLKYIEGEERHSEYEKKSKPNK